MAYSFLHGKLYMVHPASWLEGAKYKGHLYSHEGVLPGVLLIPFVAIFGETFNLRIFAALVGGGVGAVVWSLATRIGLRGRDRVLGWAFPVIGTTLWYEAKQGSSWGVAALVSAFFLFCALNEYFGRRRLPLVGLFVGLAAASRAPAILALGGFAFAIALSPDARRSVRTVAGNTLRLGSGAIGPVLVIAAYNFLRFGTVFDRAGTLHYLQDPYRLQVPPGEFSLAHVPFNLYSWFFLGPSFQSNFPWVHLNLLGNALPLTSPAFVTAFGAKRERWMWFCALFVLIPAALLYANGFTQFGMRYLLDAVPFLTALIFFALRDRRAHGYLPLLVASIVINAYGVAYTTVFGLR
jgi:hypothetical protein